MDKPNILNYITEGLDAALDAFIEALEILDNEEIDQQFEKALETLIQTHALALEATRRALGATVGEN